jgi:hypothetical protein
MLTVQIISGNRLIPRLQIGYDRAPPSHWPV